MAERSVFVVRNHYPWFEEIRVSMDWYQGFAMSQKRKSQISLHKNFEAAYPNEKVLEISSASLYSLGVSLSAMNLKKETQNGIACLESVFQASRIYGEAHDTIGPFPECLFWTGKDSKRYVKEKSMGLHSYMYTFEGRVFYAPEHFISLFYNFLYLNALLEPENRAVAEALLAEGYTAFTDLATTSLNSQARAAAIFVALTRNGLIDEVRDYEAYLRLFRTAADGKPIGPEAYENVQLLKPKGGVALLSPLVPLTFTREETDRYYAEHCAGLSNYKNDPNNYLDRCVFTA